MENKINEKLIRVIYRDFYTTRGVAPWWSGERMQLQHMKDKLRHYYVIQLMTALQTESLSLTTSYRADDMPPPPPYRPTVADQASPCFWSYTVDPVLQQTATHNRHTHAHTHTTDTHTRTHTHNRHTHSHTHTHTLLCPSKQLQGVNSLQ